MSEPNSPNQNEKAAKIRRKPEQESVLSSTFAAVRQAGSNDRRPAQSPGNGLLQRQCSCGKHTIAGGKCEECQKKQESTSQLWLDETGGAVSSNIQTFREYSSRFDFSSIPARTLTTTSKPVIQPSLTVNVPGDQYEQEADQVADAVMRMPDVSPDPSSKSGASTLNGTTSRSPLISPIQTNDSKRTLPASSQVETPITQTQSEDYPWPEAEPALTFSLLRSPDAVGAALQLKEEEEEVSQISMKSLGNGDHEVPEEIENRLSQSKGGGSNLPDPIRAFMEQSIGADFSRVKIHNDNNAVQMSKDLSAQAFTHGSDIYFNNGKYNPYSTEGKHLLAHELTHVVQQNNGLQRKLIQRRPVEEPKKYAVIDYKKAKSDNLDSWYNQYKFFNLFKAIVRTVLV